MDDLDDIRDMDDLDDTAKTVVGDFNNIVKAVVIFVGILLFIGSFPVYFGAMFVISDDTSGDLAGIAVGLFIVGIILIIIGKVLPKSKIVCEICKYTAKDETELKNHYLTHEREETPTQKKTKYFQCEFCSMYFEKEVEKLNHYRDCEERQKQEPDKKLDD